MGRAALNGLIWGLIGFFVVGLLAALLTGTSAVQSSVPPNPNASQEIVTPSDGDEVSADALNAGATEPGEGTSVPMGEAGQRPEYDAAPVDTPGDGESGKFDVPDWIQALPFFAVARIQRSRLLEHPIRRRVVDTIREHPGINHRELRRMLGVANGTLEYHLGLLESARYLYSIRAHGRKFLFVNGEQGDAHAVTVTKRERDVLRVLSQVQSAALAELGRALEIGVKGAAYHLGRLRADGLVGCRREGHALVFYRPEGSPTSKVCTTNRTRP